MGGIREKATVTQVGLGEFFMCSIVQNVTVRPKGEAVTRKSLVINAK